MYDIDRFINEKLSVNFDNEQEILDFADCCAKRGIGQKSSFWKDVINKQPYAVVYNWEDRKRILMGPDDFHVQCGWESIKAADLLIITKISEASLKQFLGE